MNVFAYSTLNMIPSYRLRTLTWFRARAARLARGTQHVPQQDMSTMCTIGPAALAAGAKRETTDQIVSSTATELETCVCVCVCVCVKEGETFSTARLSFRGPVFDSLATSTSHHPSPRPYLQYILL